MPGVVGRRDRTPSVTPRPVGACSRTPAAWPAPRCPAGGRRRRPATPSRRRGPARAACRARNRLRRRGFGVTEIGRRDRLAGHQVANPVIVSLSTTIRWSASRLWVLSTSSDLASSSGRRWVTTTAHTIVTVMRALCTTPTTSRSGFLEHLADMPGGVLALVGPHDVLDAAGHLDGAVVDPHRGLAQSGQEFVGMACEHQDSGPLDQALQPRLRLLQEVGIDGADAFVEQQDLGVDTGDHAHRQPHPHTGGVGPQRHRQVLAEFGELRDLVDLGQHLLAGLSEEEPADDDVLVAGDLRVHADAEIEHRCDPAA